MDVNPTLIRCDLQFLVAASNGAEAARNLVAELQSNGTLAHRFKLAGLNA